MQPLFTANGLNGQVELYENKIVIIRKGFFAKISQGFTKGNKEIFIKSLTGIQLKKNSLITGRGYIQFVFPGSQESKKGLNDAFNDENSVLFTSSHKEEFLRLKELIENLMTKGIPTSKQPNNSYEDLEKLATLKEKGIITEEEFQLKKKQILGL